MGSDLKYTTLGEITEKVVTGGTPFTSNKEFYKNASVPWLKTKEVNFCRIHKTENYISELGLEKSSAKLIPPNSVIIAMYGQGDTAGRVAVNKIPLATNQACCNLIIQPDIADYQFVYYYLKDSYSELVRRKTGSAQPNLNTKILKEFEILLPTLPEQKAIAHILGSLDDKIELNRQMNETLESMAQALFKSWFVDFDPVIDNALAAGNPIPDVFAERAALRIPSPPAPLPKGEGSIIKSPLPSGEGLGEGEHAYAQLDKNSDEKEKPHKSGGVCFDSAQQPSFHSSQNSHQSLFPSEFEFTDEMGWIPKGWEEGSLSDISFVKGGYAFKGKDFANEGVPVIKIKNIRSDRTVNINDVQYIPQSIAQKAESFWLNTGDLIMAMTGATVGKFGLLVNDHNEVFLLNQRVAKFHPLKTISDHIWFSYCNLCEERTYNSIVNVAEGSAQPNISADGIMATKIIKPKDSLISNFDKTVDSFFQRILKNNKQAYTLSKLRDTLLPKLLSGELRVPDAEQLIKEAKA